MKQVLAGIVITIGVALSGSSVAALIRYDVSAVATANQAPLTARLIVDQATPDALGGGASDAAVYEGAIIGGTVTFGGTTAAVDTTDAAGNYIQIINDAPAGPGLFADDVQFHVLLTGGTNFLLELSSLFSSAPGGRSATFY